MQRAFASPCSPLPTSRPKAARNIIPGTGTKNMFPHPAPQYHNTTSDRRGNQKQIHLSTEGINSQKKKNARAKKTPTSPSRQRAYSNPKMTRQR